MRQESRAYPIGIYEYLNYGDLSEAFRPYDERFPAVARRVVALIAARMPAARVEHVGSSAIPGCAGKGLIDLLFLYAPGGLAAARDMLDGLGFQRQTGIDPFPEERPLRVGAIEHDGETFRLHVHVIQEDAPEAREQLYFRERLRAAPELVAEYVAVKQRALSTLVEAEDARAPNIAYNQGKEPFIQRILAELNK